MKIEKFEDIKAWQEARKLVSEIYKITDSKTFRKDFGLRDQARRSSVSIMANIAEGFDSKSKLEFAHFLTYAQRSASETQSHIYVALDQKYIADEEFQKIYQQTIYIKNLIGAFMRYLAHNPKKHDSDATEVREYCSTAAHFHPTGAREHGSTGAQL
ncbi:four helix bundle protein [Elusimicrobiota bacterium]